MEFVLKHSLRIGAAVPRRSIADCRHGLSPACASVAKEAIGQGQLHRRAFLRCSCRNCGSLAHGCSYLDQFGPEGQNCVSV